MKKLIIHFIYCLGLLNFIHWNLYKIRMKFIFLIKMNLANVKKENIYDEGSLIKLILNNSSKHKSDVCHIIGSGSSLKQTIGKIREDDYVMGCNLAGLINIKFDFFTIEFAGYKRKEPSSVVFNLARKLSDKGTLVCFKNIWEKANEPNFIIENNFKNLKFIKDIYIRTFAVNNKDYLRKLLNLSQDGYFYQHISSIILLISVAKKIGCKKIVLHGVDFGGKYFYEDENFFLPNELNEFDRKSIYNYIKINIKNGKYQNHLNLKFPENLILIKEILYENDVCLYSNSEESGSGKILPIYNF